MEDNRITNVAPAILGTDAVTKDYCDSITATVTVKPPCRLASTVPLSATYYNGSSGVGATLTATSNGLLTLDSVPVVAGNRVLIKNQTSRVQNGIYVVNLIGNVSTQWVLTRATDSDGSEEGPLKGGCIVIVQAGTSYNGLGFVMSNPDGTAVIGTDNIDWVQLSRFYEADESTLDLTGTTFSINSTYVGQSSITTVGTVTTGTWQASTVALAYGGTGATTASDARDNLELGSLAIKDSIDISSADITGTLQIVNGGTGAITASDARTNLGLRALATMSTIDISTYTTGTLDIERGGTGAITVSGARDALGLGDVASLDNIDVSSNTSGTLPIERGGTGAATAEDARAALNLGELSIMSTIDISTHTTGTLDIARGGTGAITVSGARDALGLGDVASLDNIDVSVNTSGTLPIERGGTGATTAVDARDNLDLGSLATMSTIDISTYTTGTLDIERGGTGAITVSGARDALGLGDVASLDNIDVSINTSGTLPIGRGGTGAITASAARTNLELRALAIKDTIDISSTDISGTLQIIHGGTGAITIEEARTNLGLSVLATKDTIDISSYTTGTLDISRGGTGATTVADIRTTLGLRALALVDTIDLSSQVINMLGVANGGTGVNALTGNCVILSKNGGAAIRELASVNNSVLVSNGSGVPTWGTVSVSANIVGVLPVANGGTGSGSALAGNRVMISDGTGTIVEASALTDGQILIGSTGAGPVIGSIAGALDQITVTPGAGTITLSLAQDICTGSIPSFAGLKLTELVDGLAYVNSTHEIASIPLGAEGQYLTVSGTDLIWQVLDVTSVTGVLSVVNGGTGNSLEPNGNRVMISDASGAIVEAAALTNGQILIGSTGAGPVIGSIAGALDQITVTPGAGTITLSLAQDICMGSIPSFAGLTLTGLDEGLAYVNSTHEVTSTSLGTDGQYLTVSGTELAWQDLDVASATGVLPVANGGTGSSIELNGGRVIMSNAGATGLVEAGEDALYITNITVDSYGTPEDTIEVRANSYVRVGALKLGYVRVISDTSLSHIAGIIGVSANSLPMTVQLPPISADTAGQIMIIKDEAGTASTGINIVATAPDTVTSGVSPLSEAWGVRRVYNDGVSQWYFC